MTLFFWTFYFVAFAAVASAVGDIKTRRKIFIYFLIGFSLIITLSDILYQFYWLALFVLLVACYIAFWLRRCGAGFNLFPSYLVIVLAISSLQIPVPITDLPAIYISLIVVSMTYFLFILSKSTWGTPSQLKRLLRSHAWKMTKLAKYCLESDHETSHDQQQVLSFEKII